MGKWLDELDFDGERANVLEQYASVSGTGEPRLDTKEFVNGDGGIDGYQVAVPKWA